MLLQTFTRGLYQRIRLEYCLEFFTDIENLLKDTLHLRVRIYSCFVILTYDTKYLSTQRMHFKH